MAKITMKTVDKRIVTALASVNIMRADVQLALLGMVQHCQEHGDKNVIITKAPDMIKAMHGLNRKAVVDFLVTFGGVVEEGTGFAAAQGVKADFKAASDCDWWTLKPDAPYAGFDFAKEIAAMIKKAENAQEVASSDTVKAEKVNVTSAQLNSLRKLAKV